VLGTRHGRWNKMQHFQKAVWGSILLALALVVIAVPAASAGNGNGPRTAPPGINSYGQTFTQFDNAQNAPAQFLGGSDVAETPAQAYASASTSQSVEIAPGLTLAQATGVAPIPTGTMQSLAARNGVSVVSLAATVSCASGNNGWQWGTWPEQQVITDWTSRCWTGSIVTSRSTSVTQSTTLCNADGAQSIVQAGGVGSGFVKWYDIGNFDCPFVTSIILDYHHQRILGMEVTGGGGYFIYTYGGS